MIQERIHGGEEPTDFAIFYRVNALSRTIEESLILTGLPYTIVGATEFYGRREIKDLLAYLRLSINPTDDHTLLRILNVPRRGIGPKTAETLVRRAKEEGRPLLESLRELPKKAIGPAASRGVEELVKVLVEAGRLAGQSIAQTLAYVVDTTDYLAYLGPLTEPEAVDRRENVEELLRAVVEFEASGGDPSTAGFLERVALLNDSEIRIEHLWPSPQLRVSTELPTSCSVPYDVASPALARGELLAMAAQDLGVVAGRTT